MQSISSSAGTHKTAVSMSNHDQNRNCVALCDNDENYEFAAIRILAGVIEKTRSQAGGSEGNSKVPAGSSEMPSKRALHAAHSK
jgi:hypothetical protein